MFEYMLIFIFMNVFHVMLSQCSYWYAYSNYMNVIMDMDIDLDMDLDIGMDIDLDLDMNIDLYMVTDMDKNKDTKKEMDYLF